MASQSTGDQYGGNVLYFTLSGTKNNLLQSSGYCSNFSTSSGEVAIINKYPFTSIPSNAKITGVAVKVSARTYGTTPSSMSKSRLSFNFVTDITSSGEYNRINEEAILLSSPLSGGRTQTTYTHTQTDASSAILTWMNNNLEKVRNGDDFGIRVYCLYSDIYYVTFSVSYTTSGTVLYDTEFDYAKWKEKGITAGTGTISNITDTGFTMMANANDTYTGESHVFKLEEGQTYTIKYDTSGDSSNECFVFFHSSESAGWSSFKNSTKKQFDFDVPSGYPYCSIRVDVNTSGQSITFSNFLIVKSSETWRLDTISSYTGRHNTDSWNFPSASRTGYTLSGWKDKNGTAYTSSSAYPSDDIVLYSQWTAQTRTISTGVTPAGSGSVTGGGTYTYGSQVTLTAIPANGYRFVQWSDGIAVNPRTVYATINVTVSAIFEALSKIFVGNNRASASYVGTAKAQAVYIGTTKIL